MKAFAAIAAGACLVLPAGCSTVPVTGRSALDMVSDRDVAKMSKAAFDEMKRRCTI